MLSMTSIGIYRSSRIASICIIVFGLLVLLICLCVIFLWAFIPGFSKTYPIVLKVSAIMCVCGIATVFFGVMFIYCCRGRHQKKRQMCESSQRRPNIQLDISIKNGGYRLCAIGSLSLPKPLTSTALRKAKSMALIPLNSWEIEKYEIFGVIHRTSSNIDVKSPLRKYGSMFDSGKSGTSFNQINNFDDGIESSDHLHKGKEPEGSIIGSAKSFSCTKSRRSLPRSSFKKLTDKSSASNFNDITHKSCLSGRRTRSDRTRRARLDQLAFRKKDHSIDDLNKAGQIDLTIVDQQASMVCSSYSCDSTNPVEPHHNKPNCCGNRNKNTDQLNKNDSSVEEDTHLPRVKTTSLLLGHDSLFNLTTADLTEFKSQDDIPMNKPRTFKHKSDSRHPTYFNKRVLLLNHSGHVLSCLTLFDDTRTCEDDRDVSASNQTNNFKFHSKLNILPIYIENGSDICTGTQSADGQHGGSHYHSSTNVTFRCKKNLSDRFFSAFRSLMNNWKNSWKTSWSMQPHIINETSVKCSLNSDEETGDNLDGGMQDWLPREQITPHETSKAFEQKSDVCCEQALISNASVFSLPAIPPSLWTAERPLWFMGVPIEHTEHLLTVDTTTNDVLLWKKAHTPDLCSETGSASSIYAFHVKPPPRLKPVTIARFPKIYVRAFSLGHMLSSTKKDYPGFK